MVLFVLISTVLEGLMHIYVQTKSVGDIVVRTVLPNTGFFVLVA